jgi:hypothetical protein
MLKVKPLEERIIKLPSGEYRLLSHTGKNLGTFDSKEAAEKREKQVQYFKAKASGAIEEALELELEMLSEGEIIEESEHQGKKVKLNKPFRTSNGPKKFSVYVKNDKGNVVKVNFGDPNMSIKRDDPNRRKNFRARHNCESPGPKHKARYWSCKFWSSTPVSDLTEEILTFSEYMRVKS